MTQHTEKVIKSDDYNDENNSDTTTITIIMTEILQRELCTDKSA